MEEREQSYKSLVDNNPDAIFSLDLNGRMIKINPATENITGYQKEELLNQTFFHFIVAPDQKKTLHHFEKSVKGESNNIEVIITHKEGDYVELNLKMRLRRCQKGGTLLFK
ncbi:PAS domain S-box-containing protein [Paenibacillus sp. yr247]|nr:PAS domain S-box-containing protein [Paenibacillus sp. yr247]